MGDRLVNVRLLWADEVAAYLFFRSETDDVEPFKRFLEDLRDLVLILSQLVQGAVDAYFRPLPHGTVEKLP